MLPFAGQKYCRMLPFAGQKYCRILPFAGQKYCRKFPFAGQKYCRMSPFAGQKYCRMLPFSGQKYCRMLQGEHSAIFLTYNKLSFVINIFVLSIFEWPFKIGFRELSGRVLDSRPKGGGFEPNRRHCIVVLEQDTFILA